MGLIDISVWVYVFVFAVELKLLLLKICFACESSSDHHISGGLKGTSSRAKSNVYRVFSGEDGMPDPIPGWGMGEQCTRTLKYIFCRPECRANTLVDHWSIGLVNKKHNIYIYRFPSACFETNTNNTQNTIL